MRYYDRTVNRSDKAGSDRRSNTDYNKEIDMGKNARNSQLSDSDPMVQKDGFLGVDDLDKMRRRKIR